MTDAGIAVAELSREEQEARYGVWAARTPQDARELLDGFPGHWWVVGGWALEAFTGVRRRHEDVDVVLLRRDLQALRDHLTGRYHLWANMDGLFRLLTTEVRDRDLPQDFFQVWVRRDAQSPWEYDLLLDPAAPADSAGPADSANRGDPATPGDVGGPRLWVNRRLPSMVLPLDEATWCQDGLRFLQPEIVLLFKARQARAKDSADLLATLPYLGAERRRWLQDALSVVHPGHPWLAQIKASAGPP